MNCYGQEIENERQISFGIYGIGYPTKYRSIIHAGALVDVSIKNKKRLYSSSSINYSGFYNYSQFHNISITSGLSWKLQKNHFCFRPSIQLGYLYLNNENSNVDYLFHGGFGRISTEVTYVTKRLEYGIQFNLGMGYGPIRYYYPNETIDHHGGRS